MLHALTKTVNTLVDTVSTLARPDSNPVKKPWTHWG
jgi:hypothetical protein